MLRNDGVEKSSGVTAAQFRPRTIFVGNVARVGLLWQGHGLSTQDTRHHQTHIVKHFANQQGRLGLTHGYTADQATPNLTLQKMRESQYHRYKADANSEA